MTILENNCMQSTASSAGYSTGGTLISAFAAYMLINNQTLPLPTMLAWVFFLSVLGVTMAIPMKRQMINVEQLRFPSGIAAAETLRALHSVGDKGMRSARALGWAGLIALVAKFWAEGLALASAALAPFMIGTWIAALNQRVFGPAWMGRTVMLSWEPMFIAAGAITGIRVCWSMFLGSITAWMIFVPLLQHRGIIQGSGYGTVVQWTLWGGVACMVTSSLLAFAMQWRTALRAFTDLGAMFRGSGRDAHDPIAAIETPRARLARPPHLRHAVLGDAGSSAALLRAGPRRLPRHRRDRHHAGGRDGEDHSAHLRRPAPGQHERQPHERERHRRRGGQQRRSAHRSQERLPARGAPAQAVHRAVRRHLRRDARHRAVLPAARARRERAGLGSVPGARRADLAGGGARALERHPRARPRQDLVHRDRRARGHRPHVAAEALPGAPAPHPVTGRHGPGMDLPLVLWPALLPRRIARLGGGEEESGVGGGVHLPRGLGLDRRREPDGRGTRNLGERAGPPAHALRPLIVATRGNPARSLRGAEGCQGRRREKHSGAGYVRAAGAGRTECPCWQHGTSPDRESFVSESITAP